jgi:two-component system sensor histidine kinase BarA
MPALAFDVQDARAGSDWLAREGSARQSDLLVALLSRFNHDLRTPLNTVVGWTHLLQQGLVDSTRSKHVADVLARNTREQTVLLDEFVDDGRAILGVMKLDPVPLRIDELVAQALERAAPLASLHGVSFGTGGLESPGASVEGDERRLKRLVYRLVAGVVRRAREAATVQISAFEHAEAVQLKIEAPVGEGDWSDAALLDLRISSFVAAMHDGELAVDGTPGRAAILLRLPRRS